MLRSVLGFILAFTRVVIFLSFFMIICLFGIMYCLLRPRNPKNTYIFGKIFGRMSMIFGIKLEIRFPENLFLPKNCIYISNHQSSFDMITVSCVVQPKTVTVGKKSLLWIPLFGILYWLSGNFLIDRYRGVHTYNSLLKIVQNVKKKTFLYGFFQKVQEVEEKVFFHLKLEHSILQYLSIFLLFLFVYLLFLTKSD